MKEKDGEKGLIDWVWNYYGKGELIRAMDERLQMIVGLWCAHPDRNVRPAIKQAINVLNFEAAIPTLPPKMPAPLCYVPTPSLSFGEADITTSIPLISCHVQYEKSVTFISLLSARMVHLHMEN